jgi:ligand-binding sensor domain-containing protein
VRGWLVYMIPFFFFVTATGQPFPDLQFHYLTEKEGLSDNEVSCITQDKDGFIWIGTADGLNRFDGYRVKHFLYNPTHINSLVNNEVYRIVPDNKDQLWITTHQGVSIYNKKTGVFRNFRHNPADAYSLDEDANSYVYTGNHDSNFVITRSSVYLFDSAFHYHKTETGIKDLEDYEHRKFESYGQIIKDREGNLWAAKFGYVFLLDQRTMRVTKVFGPFAGDILSLYQDTNLQYWIGSFGGGLMNFNPENGKAYTIQLASPSNIVYSITEWKDQHGKRWLVLAGDHGLVLVDPVTRKSKEYTFHFGLMPQQVLDKNAVGNVFVDRQNILWVATEAGVAYAVPSGQQFELWNIAPATGLLPTIVNDWIYSICEVPGGYWMSRWTNPGLFYFNRDGKLEKSLFRIKTNSGTLPLSDTLDPYFLLSRGDGSIWFTTAEYLVHYTPQSGKVALFKPPDASAMTGLRSILIINDHTWWIRTRNNGPNGIYVFDPVTGKFTKHFQNTHGCKGCVPPYLLCVFLSKERKIYVTAVDKGLLQYDPSSDQFVPVFNFQGTELAHHSNSFESVAEDPNGMLWIATYSGVFLLNPATKKIIKDYSDNDLIGGTDVSFLLLDDSDNVWLNTNRGIYYLLHSNGQIRKLAATEGLKNNSNGTFQAGSDHSIFDGIQGYVLRIFPDQLLKNASYSVPIHFSDVTITDTPAFFHYTSSGQKELIISPGKNRFTIDFSVLNYDGDNRYYYRLDNLMNGWQANENGHLSFYNLPPGTYTLHVKGGPVNSDLPGNEDELAIIVQPYWWQTTWFRFVVLAAMVAVTAFLIRRRIMNIRREATYRQKIAETEMMALRSQMNPHFIFNSLNSIENFMMKNEKRQATIYLNKFARLIRMILDSSRNELVPFSKDVEALQLYADLEQLRFNHKFCFRLDIDPSLTDADFKVPALIIQPYVENAIIHGIAHSIKDHLTLQVTATLKDDFIHYSITDDGIGRKISAKIYEQSKPHRQSLGLTITADRIQIFNQKNNAHGGGVTITDLFDESGEPSGTRVDVLIKAI